MLMTHAPRINRVRQIRDVDQLPPRYYDTTIGRFTSLDTYEGQIIDPLTLQRYAYVANDPINNIDPTGHTTLREGQAAHKVITAIYRFDHPNAIIQADIKPYSGGTKGKRADIINYTGDTIDTGLLAEIKTPGEAKTGDRELQGYLADYNAKRVANNTWLRDSSWDPSLKVFWLGAADPGLSKTFGIITANLNGVIVYTTFSANTPPPEPLPIPLPVAEQVTKQIYVYDTNYDVNTLLNPRPQPIPVIPRELIYQTILAGAALGTAQLLVRMAVPAIAGYLQLGFSTVVAANSI